MAEKKMSAFEVLKAVDVSEHTETKDTGKVKLTYLSWAWAWAEVKTRYPDAKYEVKKFDGLPYICDPLTGYMVYTTVTIEGITHEMWLPVMDGNNRAMKTEPYEVQTKYNKFTVQPATMFDVNKTIMRCLTKNLAMFGLGLYIYAGEDLPVQTDEQTIAKPKAAPKKQVKADPERPTNRDLLREYMINNGIDNSEIVKACGLNPNSTDEDYARALDYAKTNYPKALEDDGQLPFPLD